ncbi:DUF3168 domain-containing protein [Qipengyuania sp.]|uniref:DUF3168 domain-containing protein n=1 Tax=Qipengyuania sp. TaxID=2004515 RepID=UPI0035C86959
MEMLFRRDLVAWLAADPDFATGLNSVGEEAPVAASPPHLAIAASASSDWGAKGAPGREIRLALQLTAREDDAGAVATLVDAIERRVATMPAAQGGYRVVVTQFLRSRAERRAGNVRMVLSEYRFLILAT